LSVSSGDDAADFEVHDGVPVDAQIREDLVPVLVELGRPLGHGWLVAELDGVACTPRSLHYPFTHPHHRNVFDPPALVDEAFSWQNWALRGCLSAFPHRTAPRFSPT
jgi:hypothetical protein